MATNLKDTPREQPDWQRKLDAAAQAAQEDRSTENMDFFAWRVFQPDRPSRVPVRNPWENCFGDPGYGE